MSHRRPRSSTRRRPTGAPLTVAAGVVLTAGLLGSMPLVAHADETAPTVAQADRGATPAAPAVAAAEKAAPVAVAAGKAASVAQAAPAEKTAAAPAPAQTQAAPSAPVAASGKLSQKTRGEFVLKAGEQAKAGTQVKWTTTLTNIGTAPLHEVQVAESAERTTLAVGESKDLVFFTTLQDKDVANGYTEADSAAAGQNLDGSFSAIRVEARLDLPAASPKPTPAPSQPATPTAPATPVASAAPSAPIAASGKLSQKTRGEFVLEAGEQVKVGTQVKWTTTLTNTGTAALHDVQVASSNDDPTTLAVGESKDFTFSTTVYKKTVANGYSEVDNDAIGLNPDGSRVQARVEARLDLPAASPKPTPAPSQPATPTATPTPAATPAPAAEQPALKGSTHGEFVVEPGARVKVGTTIKWTTTVTNTGDVALHDVHVTDSKDRVTLAVGESKAITFFTTVQPKNVVDGYTFNDFTATGSGPAGSVASVHTKGQLSLPTRAVETRVAIDNTGEFVVEPGEQVKAGTRVKWTITVTNKSGIDLHNVSAAVDGGPRSETLAVLAKGEIKQIHLETVVTERDLEDGLARVAADVQGEAGDGTFTAVANGKLLLQTETPRLEGSMTGRFDLQPERPVTVGTKVIWSVTVKNTGDVFFDGFNGIKQKTIAVGETQVYEVTDTVTEADLAAGVVSRQTVAWGARPNRPLYNSVPILGVLRIPAATGGDSAGTPTDPGATAGTTPTPTPSNGATTGDATAPADPIVVGQPAGTGPRSTATKGSPSTADSAVKGSTASNGATASKGLAAETPRTTDSSAAHLAHTGVDTASALPAAGILGLLGALGLFLGGRRRRNSTAD
ncbi:LPXTG cell wall anchor domain-containing protein [Rathayibacter sp. VKM Ac-2760]|uniref:DUF7507 domain-containing protein n=1 Tax=Rathayibacter sp. VKM Ac-2760 TaxID=2609253 RepID=UPI001318598C|nr:LPXTG cell wall anchor domain-containing protein [Rathayibacter sp. VKM Ac-2760]QHC57483.1 LPXTG cell wall anchor domain-containing protein [Rathayibacter sp. VKM Ac-2760]